MLPNFLIIGAAKSGTSALWSFLKQHPAIYMAPRKEPHFFSAEEKQHCCEGPGDYQQETIDVKDYEALFEGARDETALGEASNSTLYFPVAIEKIKQHVPQAKLIAMLRQPADRAFSAYMHLRRDGRETVEDFAEALALEEKRMALKWSKMWYYRTAGLYYTQLKRFYDAFPHDQIRVYLYDDFAAKPLGVVQDIFRFLDVDPLFEPDLEIRANQSGVPKYPRLNAAIGKIFDRPNPLRYVSRKLIPEDRRRHFTLHMRSRNLVKQTIPPDVRRDLTDSLRDEILNLQDLIGRDLSNWLEPR